MIDIYKKYTDLIGINSQRFCERRYLTESSSMLSDWWANNDFIKLIENKNAT